MTEKSDIELIKKDIAYIRQFIEEDRKKFDKHIEESFSYRTKVDEMSAGGNEKLKSFFKEFRNHVISDQWAFGIMVTMLLAILGRVLMK